MNFVFIDFLHSHLDKLECLAEEIVCVTCFILLIKID